MSIDLRKEKAKISIAKKSIPHENINVILVLDMSGSMRTLYESGVVQDVVERILALSVNLDSDKILDCWLYDHKYNKIDSITESDYQNYVAEHILKDRTKATFGGNNEPLVMRKILETYSSDYKESEAHEKYLRLLNERTSLTSPVKSKSVFDKIKNLFGIKKEELNVEPVTDKLENVFNHKDKTPNFIIFISDGGCEGDRRLIQSKDFMTVLNQDNMRNVIVESSKYNVFWQFVGIGRGNFGILQSLDTIRNSYIDNANFICLDDIKNMDDEALYDLLLNEFPSWLKLAKEKGIIV